MTARGTSKHPPDVREAIAAEWMRGTRTGAIAAKVGLKKNAVIGLIHRMGLPPRESPIRPRTCRDDVVGCQWIDDNGARCGAAGYPYCTEHATKVYRKHVKNQQHYLSHYVPRRDGL